MTLLTIISQEMIRIWIMNWSWYDHRKFFNWWQLNLTLSDLLYPPATFSLVDVQLILVGPCPHAIEVENFAKDYLFLWNYLPGNEKLFFAWLNFHAIQTYLVIPFFSKWDFSQRFASYKKGYRYYLVSILKLTILKYTSEIFMAWLVWWCTYT